MELRSQCKPHGPIGYLLETAHLNAATIDAKGVLRQEGQPPIDILGEAYQDFKKSFENSLLESEPQRQRTADMGTST